MAIGSDGVVFLSLRALSVILSRRAGPIHWRRPVCSDSSDGCSFGLLLIEGRFRHYLREIGGLLLTDLLQFADGLRLVLRYEFAIFRSNLADDRID